jgi:hypothetical protein
MRHVIQDHRRGMIAYAVGENLFERKDNGDNWDMRKMAISGVETFWEVGWLHRDPRCELAFQIDPSNVGFSPSYFYPRVQPPPKYWWCRDADWLPYWGKLTEKRANLMKELRTHWMNKWFGKTVPEIKKTILETTPIPEDIVEILPEYFEYPYQTKMVV